MTRVLYWNIQQFSGNKIGDPDDPGKSANRLGKIIAIVTAMAPDIFVVVEVSTGWNAPGELITAGQGERGTNLLLGHLQALAADWRLVPPLVVGQEKAEGVAVFYRGTTTAGGQRIFTGPNRWSGGIGGRSVPGGAAAVAYPGTQTAWFGVSRAVPAAARPAANIGRQENVLAACVGFTNAAGAACNFGNYREPYLCTFSETAVVGGPATRNISLFAVHTKPRSDIAAATMQTFATATEIAGALGAGEVRVIVGDFNLNLLNADGTDALAAPAAGPPNDTRLAYAPFLGLNYVPLLRMPGPPPGAEPDLSAYKGYATTHIKKRKARFMSRGGGRLDYPGFGYAGAATRSNLYSIDNILVLQNPALANYNMTVANNVVGMPYLNPLAVAHVPFTTALPFGPFPVASTMNVPVVAPIVAAFPWAVAAGSPNLNRHTIGTASTLFSWLNYGSIYSTSDHFALCAEV
jgi:hypothetical protein